MTTAEILALTPEQLEVSPGVGAFTVFFVLAIAMVLLVLNMSKHLRRVDRHRIEAEVRAEFEAEQAQRKAERDAAAEVEGAAGGVAPGRGDSSDVVEGDGEGERE